MKEKCDPCRYIRELQKLNAGETDTPDSRVKGGLLEYQLLA